MAKGPPPGTGGRPHKGIDLAVVRRAASLGCTHEEIATLVGVERSTIQRRLVDDPKVQRTINEGREQGRTTLRRLQWQRANAGSDTMLIWLGKQLLNQRDRFDATAHVTHTIGGIDRPAKIIEGYAEWLDRARDELEQLEHDPQKGTEHNAASLRRQ